MVDQTPTESRRSRSALIMQNIRDVAAWNGGDCLGEV